MRIAYLNPWRQAAENQCFKSLEEAAARIGCKLVHCSSSDEILEANPDFVLAVASTQPKLTHIPTYGVIHEPKDRFLSNQTYFTNLLTYDGYLTLSDSIRAFLSALLIGVRRDDPIGCFYTTCQSNELHSTQVATALQTKQGKLTYFGTHWDKRRHSFFKELSKLPGVEIYGPVHAWRHIENSSAYKGPLPFDGQGPQKKYAENALGLVLMADKHLLDNVISNRIFEITSVGAVAICPRMPWIEEHYGDSVYYFNQLVSDQELLEQLTKIIAEIHAHPDEALRRAQRAQQIFRENFSAEQLLKNACAYHEHRLQAARAKKEASASASPLITVIVRTDASGEALERSLNSIANQTAGRFAVLVVRAADVDITATRGKYLDRFAEFRVLDCFHGNPSQTLWHALQHVTGRYFCLLDEGDEWLPNHIENLLPENLDQKTYFSYTGSIGVAREPVLTGEKILERRAIASFGDCRTVEFFDAVQFFSSNCFLASVDLLDRFILQPPNVQTAEDSLLILELLCKTEPRFNHRATALQYESAHATDRSTRAKDLLEILCRLAGKVPRWTIMPDIYPALSAKVAEFFESEAKRHNWKVNIAAAPTLPAVLSPRAVRGPETFSEWRARTFGRWHRSLHKRFPKLFPKTDHRPRHTEKTLGIKPNP